MADDLRHPAPDRTSWRCACCGNPTVEVFFEQRDVPVHSMILCTDAKKARAFPRGDIILAHCPECDYVANVAFDDRFSDYGPNYESSQSSSAVFEKFHDASVAELVERHGLRGKRILEIGCGQGEFLRSLCGQGGNTGIGVDPAYIGPREIEVGAGRVEFLPKTFSADLPIAPPDFICCKMTLEHISRPAEFVATVRRFLGDRHDITVFFQVPEAVRIFRGIAFWDVYYEHCAYFSPAALSSLFIRQGFEVVGLKTVYDGQYLAVEARPAANGAAGEGDLAAPVRSAPFIESYVRRASASIEGWRQRFAEAARQGQRVILWGGGSKAAALVSATRAEEFISYIVDVNPRKWHTYLPGSGLKVVPPETVRDKRPDLVVVMNPIYTQEIRNQLAEYGADPSIAELVEDMSLA